MTTLTYTFADGKTVNRLGFGAMRLTGQPGNFGPYADWEAGKALLRKAVDLGVHVFDTARGYGPGWNEELIADALAPYDPALMIATKGGIEKDGPTAANIRTDGRPEALARHVRDALRRLKTDCIDLFYLHRPDPNVPFVESIGALEAERQAGRIARIGVSNVTLEQLKLATRLAPISAVQNRYDPLRGGDDALLDVTTAEGIAFVPWGPLGAEPLKPGAPLAEGGVEGKSDLTPVQRALAALLSRAPNVLPIPGTTSANHLEKNMRVLAP